jgi:hypothetical protein
MVRPTFHRSCFPKRLTRVLIAAALVCLWTALPGHLQASEPDSSSTEQRRVVVLNVPGGGTERLVDGLAELDHTELERQKWFISELRRHGLSPKGIMTEHDDLQSLMRRSSVDFILFLRPNGDQYQTKLLEGPEASAVLSLEIERTDDGLSETGASRIAETIREHFAAMNREKAPARATAGRNTPNQSRDPADPATQADHSSNPLRIWSTARGRLFYRSFTATGAGNAVLRYNSGAYPGLELDIEAFPFGDLISPLAPIGVYIDFRQGFDSVRVSASGGRGQRLSLSHLELEGGVLGQLGGPPSTDRRHPQSRFRLKATTRHSRFIVDANEALPSISTTSVVLGGLLTEPILVDNLAAQAELELVPVAFFHAGADLFGRNGYTNGFSTRLGLIYSLPMGLRALAGYRFRLRHTRFTGPGASAFRNSEVFELVQGIDVGIQYAY